MAGKFSLLQMLGFIVLNVLIQYYIIIITTIPTFKLFSIVWNSTDKNNIITDPFETLKKTINVNSKQYSYYDLPKFGAEYGNINNYYLHFVNINIHKYISISVLRMYI